MRRAGALLLAILLAGCSGNGLAPEGPATASLAAPAAPEKAAFNPFSQDQPSAVGRREVIENPSLAEVMKAGPLGERSLGREDAPVTIIKYASLTCPYCRRFQADVFPTLKREYIDTGKVRFIIREFPIGQSSGTATIAWRCAPPEKFFAMYDKYMAQQAAWVSLEVRHDAIFKIAQQGGMSRAEYDACQKNEELVSGLRWVKDRGRTLGVIGTPNFFINGRLIKQALDLRQLRDIIDPIIAGKVAASGPAAPAR